MKFAILLVGILSFTVPLAAQRNTVSVHNGNRLYKEHKYEQAVGEYKKAAAQRPNDAVVQYNLGNAYVKTRRFAEAENAFNVPAAEGNGLSLRQAAYYNKGVALTRQNKLEESIEAYKTAVKLNPADQDARINLQKALLELKKKQPPEPDKKEEQKKQNQKNKTENKSPRSQSTMNKKQVEQLLRALRQREQQVQQKMQQYRNRSAGKQEKDW